MEGSALRGKSYTRRRFLGQGAAAATAVFAAGGTRNAAAALPAVDAGFEDYVDDKTGARVHRLTDGQGKDSVVYQTHPMWTPHMAQLVFYSDRGGEGFAPQALDMKTGVITRLVDGKCGASTLAWNATTLAYLVDRQVYALDVPAFLENRGPAQAVAELPGTCQHAMGMLSVGADEKTLYTGALIEEEKRWAILALDLEAKTWRTVVELDFQVGHVQASPDDAGALMFCHETGGDATQRMWYVRTDGTGMRPFYKETYGEWVTHEAWWGKDRVIFTIWPYDKAHREQPHGIAVAHLDKPSMEVLSQYRAWHTHGSPDGKWAMGDDFARNLWLIDVATKERRLLTQSHNGDGFETHPHASFTPDSKAIVFNSSRFGSEDICLVVLPEWDRLPKLSE